MGQKFAYNLKYTVLNFKY